jgi:hypothetical protein
MFSPSIGDVVFKAMLLAQGSGASEIGIDILLTAIDAPMPNMPPPESPGAESCGFVINSDWTPLSSEVVEALAPFGGLEEISLEALRTALLSAKKKRPG